MRFTTPTRAVMAAAVAGLTIGGVAIAGAAGGDDEGRETPITGAALQRAGAAALARIGGGTVTETEVGDEDGYYEVEVTRRDGSRVDVHLNRDFTILGSESDREDER
jgi:uncharacterized membrane protein YkoI